MSIAIETRHLAKSFRSGSGHCFAAARVLYDVNLAVVAGDALAIVGRQGSGKSVLMLCLAGLLSPDLGFVRWFGDPAVASAARHVLLHRSKADLMRFGRCDAPHVHLVDLDDSAGLAQLADWVASRQLAGDAVILAARDRSRVPTDWPMAVLAEGRVRRVGREAAARVAEGASG